MSLTYMSAMLEPIQHLLKILYICCAYTVMSESLKWQPKREREKKKHIEYPVQHKWPKWLKRITKIC
jgi:hypothetical protein